MSDVRLHFVPVLSPGRQTRIVWPRPEGAVNGYLVVSTERPFPPEMSPQFFAGNLREHCREVPLGPEVAAYQTDVAAAFYTVLYLDDRGRWLEAPGVREVGPALAPTLAVEPTESEQARTWNRGRWSPPLEATDREVALFVRSDRPDADALGAMLSGFIEPDYVLSQRSDGFIDTVTEPGFRVHYVALAVDKFQHRRPLRLVVSGFQRLEEPAYLSPSGKSRVAALCDRVLEQLEVELMRRSLTAEELAGMLERADDLMPGDVRLGGIRERARMRFPGLG